MPSLMHRFVVLRQTCRRVHDPLQHVLVLRRDVDPILAFDYPVLDDRQQHSRRVVQVAQVATDGRPCKEPAEGAKGHKVPEGAVHEKGAGEAGADVEVLIVAAEGWAN